MPVLANIAKWLIQLLLTVFGEKLVTWAKEMIAKAKAAAAARAKRKADEEQFKKEAEALKKAQTADEIDKAADDTLSNL